MGLSRRFYYASSGDASCGGSKKLLYRESPTQPHFRGPKSSRVRNYNYKGNWNRHQQGTNNSIESSRIATTSQFINTVDNSEMLDLMIYQYSSLYRGIKRLGFPARVGRPRFVNSNDDGLVMCSTCYYYTKVGESCWHCGNSC